MRVAWTRMPQVEVRDDWVTCVSQYGDEVRVSASLARRLGAALLLAAGQWPRQGVIEPAQSDEKEGHTP